MKKFDIETITETIDRKINIRYECDGCGVDIPDVGKYDFRSFTLEFREGRSDMDGGGYANGWKVEDLCDKCVAKLRRMLQGGAIMTRDIEEDW